eukprot:CAMPEP_0176437738 /NCGR_PEP_ID=MMETSP0127-20121128/18823_1 /TAXON_ID=938130 /ORGANISM="Platyophrya macrostoma, Strain WH" /LENGTH=72 /DNA_ID=CAMNT_0017821467 /DNA_START=511 /DNA_END=729 /DNA_ORIENTATION=-
MPPDQYQANIGYNQTTTGYNPYMAQNTYPQPNAYGQPAYDQNQQFPQQHPQYNQYQGYNAPVNDYAKTTNMA